MEFVSKIIVKYTQMREQMKRYDKKDVFNQFNKIHKEIYSYENFVYVNDGVPGSVTCKKIGKNGKVHGDWLTTPSHHKNGHGCPKCYNETRGCKRRLKNDIALKRAKDIWGTTYLYKNFNYKKSNENIIIICNKSDDIFGYHGEFSCNFHNHTKRNKPTGCPKCAGNSRLTNEIIDGRLKNEKRNKDIKRIENIKGSLVKINWKCLKCDNIFRGTPSYIIQEGHGCPKCNNYKSQMQIKAENILKDLNIDFIDEHKFKDCKDKKCLPMDLYLPKYNVVIELDGRHHSELVQWPGLTIKEAKNQFNITKKHDRIRNDFCNKSKIKLLRISHKDKKHMKEIILEFIQNPLTYV